MKKITLFGATVASIFSVFGSNAVATEDAVARAPDSKILVAYYSYSGNTKEVAEAIHEKVGGDLFEIKAEGTYPDEYRPMTQQAKEEIQNGFRPKLTTSVDNMAQYDIVFIGSPNWWGTITPQVSSFLESYDLTGKTVIPFITHGGGGQQNTVADLAEQCKGCRVIEKNAWVGYGSRTLGISGWLKDLGL